MTKIRRTLFLSFLFIFLIFVILLSSVFPGRLVLPQAFLLGPITIRYYGLCLAVAAIAGYVLAKKGEVKYKIDSKVGDDIIFWSVIGGLIGARIYHVASSFNYYRLYPAEIFQIWQGGLSIYGAVIGGVVSLLLLNRIFNFQFSIFKVLDWLTPSLVLGQIMGRFGNMFNYELFGYPTNLPWKMFVPVQFRPGEYAEQTFFHPLFLYESLCNSIILFILLKVIKPKVPGVLFFWYILLYNIGRFCLEYIRIDSVFIGNIRQNAVVSAVIICTAFTGLLILGKNKGSSQQS